MALVSDVIMLMGDKGVIRKLTHTGNPGVMYWDQAFYTEKINALIQPHYEVSSLYKKVSEAQSS